MLINWGVKIGLFVSIDGLFFWLWFSCLLLGVLFLGFGEVGIMWVYVIIGGYYVGWGGEYRNGLYIFWGRIIFELKWI